MHEMRVRDGAIRSWLGDLGLCLTFLLIGLVDSGGFGIHLFLFLGLFSWREKSGCC